MRLLSLPLILTLLLAPTSAWTSEVIDGIAAQVGGEIVLVSEVLQAAAPAEARIRADGGGKADVERLRLEILERMIERALIRQVVKRAELDASDPEVDGAIGDIARENQLTIEELRSTVESQGMPFTSYRERIRGEIENQKVVSAMVASKVRLDEDEVQGIFEKEFANQPSGGEEFFLRQILVPTQGDSKKAINRACIAAGGARARVAGGESFKVVASQVSQVNPEVGGAIGWLHEGELAGWMKEAVDGLQPGDMSQVVEAPFGCSVILVVERRPYEKITWEKARDPMMEQVFDSKMGEEYAKFIESLREQTYIERKGIFAESTSRLDPDAGSEGDF